MSLIDTLPDHVAGEGATPCTEPACPNVGVIAYVTELADGTFDPTPDGHQMWCGRHYRNRRTS